MGVWSLYELKANTQSFYCMYSYYLQTDELKEVLYLIFVMGIQVSLNIVSYSCLFLEQNVNKHE